MVGSGIQSECETWQLDDISTFSNPFLFSVLQKYSSSLISEEIEIGKWLMGSKCSLSISLAMCECLFHVRKHTTQNYNRYYKSYKNNHTTQQTLYYV